MNKHIKIKALNIIISSILLITSLYRDVVSSEVNRDCLAPPTSLPTELVAKPAVKPQPLNILLVIPPAQGHMYTTTTLPLGIPYLASALRGKKDFQRKFLRAISAQKPQYETAVEFSGHNVKILDMNVEDEGFDLEGYLKDLNSEWETTGGIQMIGVNIFSTTIEQARDVFAISQDVVPDALRLAGGVHPSVEPHKTIEDLGAEVSVIGEGEETVSEIALLYSLCDRKKRDLNLTDVEGCAYKNGLGQFQMNDRRKFVVDLDDYPWSADSWDLFDVEKYQDQPAVEDDEDAEGECLVDGRVKTEKVIDGKLHITYTMPTGRMLGGQAKPLPRKRWARISIVRGCPFNCVFCASKSMVPKMRVRSAEDVVAEMLYLYREYKIEQFRFEDETFIANRRRVERFVELLEKLKTEEGVEFEWMVQTRADTIDEELLSRMKDAGLISISMGIETIGRKLSKDLGKRLRPDEATTGIETALRLGLQTDINLMVGLPGQNWVDVLKTVRWVERLHKKYPYAELRIIRFVAIPYPGSKLDRGNLVRITKPGDNYPPVHGQWLRFPNEGKKLFPKAVTETDDMTNKEIEAAFGFMNDIDTSTAVRASMEKDVIDSIVGVDPDDELVCDVFLEPRSKAKILKYVIADMICRAQEGLTKEKRESAWKRVFFYLKSFEPPQANEVVTSIRDHEGIPQDEGILDRICDFTEMVSFENGHSFMEEFQRQEEFINFIYLSMALWYRLGREFASIRFLHADRLTIVRELREFLYELAADEILEFGLEGKNTEHFELREDAIVVNGVEIPFSINGEKLELDLVPDRPEVKSKAVVLDISAGNPENLFTIKHKRGIVFRGRIVEVVNDPIYGEMFRVEIVDYMANYKLFDDREDPPLWFSNEAKWAKCPFMVSRDDIEVLDLEMPANMPEAGEKVYYETEDGKRLPFPLTIKEIGRDLIGMPEIVFERISPYGNELRTSRFHVKEETVHGCKVIDVQTPSTNYLTQTRCVLHESRPCGSWPCPGVREQILRNLKSIIGELTKQGMDVGNWLETVVTSKKLQDLLKLYIELAEKVEDKGIEYDLKDLKRDVKPGLKSVRKLAFLAGLGNLPFCNLKLAALVKATPENLKMALDCLTVLDGCISGLRDEDGKIRAQSAEGIVSLVKAGVFTGEELKGKIPQEEVIQGLCSTEGSLRAGNARVIELLVEASLIDRGDVEERIPLAELVSAFTSTGDFKQGSIEAINSLIKVYLITCRHSESRELLGELIKGLTDPVGAIRIKCAEAIASAIKMEVITREEIENTSILADLIRGLSDSEGEMRARCAEALGQFPAAFEMIIDYDDIDRIKEGIPLDILIQGLSSPEGHVRAGSAEAIKLLVEGTFIENFEEGAALDQLVSGSSDSCGEVRARTAETNELLVAIGAFNRSLSLAELVALRDQVSHPSIDPVQHGLILDVFRLPVANPELEAIELSV